MNIKKALGQVGVVLSVAVIAVVVVIGVVCNKCVTLTKDTIATENITDNNAPVKMRLRSISGVTREVIAYNNDPVKIGGLMWTKNLNVETIDSWCYDNNPSCAKYGRLYTWDAAKSACASMGGEWRLPTSEDWNNLMKTVGGVREEDYDEGGYKYVRYVNAGRTLKSKNGWARCDSDGDDCVTNGNGTDDYGFSAMPGGVRSYNDSSFGGVGNFGIWWSISESSGGAYLWLMRYNSGNVVEFVLSDNKKDGFAVRCCSQDTVTITKYMAVTENITYNNDPVEIGSLTWTKNLNIETPDSWCYDNDSSNCEKYGRLYTWEAAKKACQSMGDEWRLPNRSDWDELVHVVGRNVAGKKLKSKIGWNDNGNGTDDYGFSALPCGYRSYIDGSFSRVGDHGNWWSASEHSRRDDAYFLLMHYGKDNVSEVTSSKKYGHAVRCCAPVSRY